LSHVNQRNPGFESREPARNFGLLSSATVPLLEPIHTTRNKTWLPESYPLLAPFNPKKGEEQLAVHGSFIGSFYKQRKRPNST
jgi:hypothetical protein